MLLNNRRAPLVLQQRDTRIYLLKQFSTDDTLARTRCSTTQAHLQSYSRVSRVIWKHRAHTPTNVNKIKHKRGRVRNRAWTKVLTWYHCFCWGGQRDCFICTWARVTSSVQIRPSLALSNEWFERRLSRWARHGLHFLRSFRFSQKLWENIWATRHWHAVERAQNFSFRSFSGQCINLLCLGHALGSGQSQQLMHSILLFSLFVSLLNLSDQNLVFLHLLVQHETDRANLLKKCKAQNAFSYLLFKLVVFVRDLVISVTEIANESFLLLTAFLGRLAVLQQSIQRQPANLKLTFFLFGPSPPCCHPQKRSRHQVEKPGYLIPGSRLCCRCWKLEQI